MPKYSVQFSSVSVREGASKPFVRYWGLDSPKGDIDLPSSNALVALRGWVLFEPGDLVKVMVRTQSGEFSYELTQPRPDVVRKVLKQGPDSHPCLTCGFNAEFEFHGDGVDLGFCVNGEAYWVCNIKMVEKPKLEEGEAGWLFLHNDNNSSVDQYTGQRLLSAGELRAWEDYFNSSKTLSKELGFSWSFLLVPAKEFIFPNYYPFKRAIRTPVDQFLEKFQNTHPIVWPQQALSDDRELTYWKGDTHWTDYGAAVGARTTLSLFGFDRFERLDAVKYVIRPRAGDLGNKLIPPKMHSVAIADLSAMLSWKIFDNQIHNHGRIRIFECPNPESQHVCVLFGDSFSVALVPWLTPFFRRLVYVHTAGSVDVSILQSEKPTHVIFQTNSRFIISPAKPNFSIQDLLESKLRQLGEEERAELQEEIRKQQSPKTSFYTDLMQKVASTAEAG